MTVSKEKILISRILAKHGARSDLRLWRNETAVGWVGKRKGTTSEGDIVLWRGASRILAGLCVGSADLVGIKMVDGKGIFIGMEVKTENVITTMMQTKWLALISKLGGIAGVVKSVEEATALLGEPPE